VKTVNREPAQKYHSGELFFGQLALRAVFMRADFMRPTNSLDQPDGALRHRFLDTVDWGELSSIFGYGRSAGRSHQAERFPLAGFCQLLQANGAGRLRQAATARLTSSRLPRGENPDGVSPLMAMEDVPAVGVRKAGAGDGDDPALPVLHHRLDHQRDRRAHHPAPERAARRTRLVVGSAGENPERMSKLQSSEPPRTLSE